MNDKMIIQILARNFTKILYAWFHYTPNQKNIYFNIEPNPLFLIKQKYSRDEDVIIITIEINNKSLSFKMYRNENQERTVLFDTGEKESFKKQCKRDTIYNFIMPVVKQQLGVSNGH